MALLGTIKTFIIALICGRSAIKPIDETARSNRRIIVTPGSSPSNLSLKRADSDVHEETNSAVISGSMVCTEIGPVFANYNCGFISATLMTGSSFVPKAFSLPTRLVVTRNDIHTNNRVIWTQSYHETPRLIYPLGAYLSH